MSFVALGQSGNTRCQRRPCEYSLTNCTCVDIRKNIQKLLQNVLYFVLQGEPGLAGPQGLKGEKGERVRVILK